MKQYSAGFSLRRNQWNVFCWHRLLSSENWVKWYYISEIVFFFRLFHLILSRQCWDRFILVFVILFLQIIPLNLDLKVLKQIYPYSLVWRMSRDGKLHGSDMSHATTASPKPSLRVPWRVGDAMVGRGNAGWTTWESGHFCPCQNCSQWPPAEKTGWGSLLNHLSCPPNDPIGQGTELNWTLIVFVRYIIITLCWILLPLSL